MFSIQMLLHFSQIVPRVCTLLSAFVCVFHCVYPIHAYCMYWVNTMVRKLSCIEPMPKVRALFQHIFCIDNYYCCACSKTSISINKYMQKAGEPISINKYMQKAGEPISINKYMQKAVEPENDAGFLKHIYVTYSWKYWRELYLADCAKIVENRNWRILIWRFSHFGMSRYYVRIKIGRF